MLALVEGWVSKATMVEPPKHVLQALRAQDPMLLALEYLKTLLSSSLNRIDASWKDLVGMGEWVELWFPESQSNMTFTAIGETPAQTSMNETEELVTALIHADVEVILYAGGDGTTRDIANTLEKIGDKKREIPLIGVPGGVKMHSGCFATTPKAAAEVALAFMIGDLRCAITEVMDLDEEIYQEGFGKYECTVKARFPALDL